MANKAASTNEAMVVVTGDVLIDRNLFPDDRPAAGYAAPLTSTVEIATAGGAWFLTEIIERMTCEVFPVGASQVAKVSGPSSDKFSTQPVATAHTRWRSFPYLKDGKDKSRAHRVEQFLGCQRQQKSESVAPGVEAIYEQTLKAKAIILIIDDLRLGFSDTPGLWPQYLQDIEAILRDESEDKESRLKPIYERLPEHIVFKMGGPPDRSKLWRLLLSLPELRQRLTVVIDANHLRARGSELSKGLSWDRTIEEILADFREGQCAGAEADGTDDKTDSKKLSSGLSAFDLGWCQRVCVVYEGGCGAALFSRDWLRMGAKDKQPVEDVDCESDTYHPPALQRFLYLPNEVEGIQDQRFDGKMFGAMSLVTASVLLHLLDSENFPVYIALGRGLATLRYNQLHGACLGDKNETMQPHWDGLIHRLAWKNPKDLKSGEGFKLLTEQADRLGFELKVQESRSSVEADPAFAYFTTWPQGEHNPISQLGRGGSKGKPGSSESRSDLLGDFAGPSLEYMYAVAAQVVRNGAKEVLESVPKAEYGAYLTVDRDEIERINAVRSLILTYLDNPADARPLSLAVFGQPGSGKSFAIKHLLKSLPGGNVAPLTFNLSEFPDDSTEALRQLHAALHEVRDKAISGSVPVVFWDEFDSGNLKWLKQFLAPMQDAEFREGSTVHPLGRAIFIFAGGTSHSFQDFTSGIDKLKDQSEKKYIKGPDFVSRLRGHINIKGPNPDVTKCGESNSRDKLDPAHIIRRAVQLRSMLERTYPQLIDKTTKKLAISESVLHGLLRVSEYRHGVRSLESVLTMSQLAGAAYFGISQLPPKEQLEMHVADDFLEGIRQGELTGDIIEPLAEACHTAYTKLRKEMGGNDAEEFDDLDEADKESNRAVARVVAAKLHEVGCKIRRRQTLNAASAPSHPLHEVTEGGITVGQDLQIREHDRWLRQKLTQGFEYVDLAESFESRKASEINTWFKKEAYFKTIRRNWNIQSYENLHSTFQDLDLIAGMQIVEKLHEFGYEIVKLDAPGG